LTKLQPFSSAIHHLKDLQDARLPASEHYIRRLMIFDNDSIPKHEEDEDDLHFKDTKLRIIVCMSPIASRRLLEHGRYLQSDIAFKRIVDFLEFEMACMDRDANTSTFLRGTLCSSESVLGLIFCQVFLNRQSAVVHQHILNAIDEIVYEDTGKRLRWRHLHGIYLDDCGEMVLEWGADQHRGQAKGALIIYCHAAL
jgi:hypothetical protein